MGRGTRRWLRRIRNGLVKVVLAGLLAAFLAAAWASNYPDAPVVHRAMKWPLVGPWITRAHRLYRPLVPASVAAQDQEPRALDPQRIVVSPPHIDKRATLMVAPGTVVRETPATEARSIVTLDTYTNLKELDRQGDWRKIWRQRRGERSLEGWIHQPDAPPGEPPLGREPEPPGPLEPQPPDPERLAVARSLLEGERVGTLGPYTLFTDNQNGILEGWLDRIAPTIEAVYVARWGLRPIGEPRAAIVVFAHEAAYEAFRQHWQTLHGLRATGHAEGGIVALWVGGQDLAAIASTLVHEVVHLLNRRTLGPALPPWLEEGLAEALDTAQVGLDGTVQPEAIGGRIWRAGEMVTWLGGRASLRQVQEAITADTLPTIEALTSLDHDAFLRDGRQSLYYAQSGFFLRYLVDGDLGRYASGLRRFLASVAAGKPPSGEALRSALGVTWEVLDKGFRAWAAAIENERN